MTLRQFETKYNLRYLDDEKVLLKIYFLDIESLLKSSFSRPVKQRSLNVENTKSEIKLVALSFTKCNLSLNI